MVSIKSELFLTGDGMTELTSEMKPPGLKEKNMIKLLILNDRNWNKENRKVCVPLFLLASPSHKKKKKR